MKIKNIIETAKATRPATVHIVTQDGEEVGIYKAGAKNETALLNPAECPKLSELSGREILDLRAEQDKTGLSSADEGAFLRIAI